jgi:hypothetical protein
MTDCLTEVALIQKKRSYFNLDVTYNRAVEQLASMEPLLIERNANTSFDPEESTFLLPFLNREYRVQYPQGKICHTDGSEASHYLSILMLHYLTIANGNPLAGEWISYRHLPGGDIYFVPFQQRAVHPFLRSFGHRPEDFSRAAAALGGYKGPAGGISMIIPVMPRVPLCFVLWPGDDELPPSANILFDAQAASYLHTEDYAHLPAIVTGEMKALLAEK